MTRTIAKMEVSPIVFEEIKGKLHGAGYHHAILEEGENELLDMSGIGLEATEPLSEAIAETDWTLEGIAEAKAVASGTEEVTVPAREYHTLLDLAEATLSIVINRANVS